MAAASKYPARAVKINDEEDAHPGSVAVTEEALIFKSSSLTLELPYADLILDFTNKRNSAVNFQHPDHPQWRITAYEHRILRERTFKQHRNLQQQIRDVRSRHQGVGKVVTTIFFIALLVGLGYVAGYAVEHSVPGMLSRMSTARDAEIGRILQPLVDERYPTSGQHAVHEEQLDGILAQLIEEEDRQRFQFKSHILDTTELVAFSLPGGDIYISAELLRLANDADKMAGILAHEAGHILNRHAVRMTVTHQGASMILRGLLGDEQGIVNAVAKAGNRLIAPVYPVPIDLEADGTAWTLLLKAKISPEAIPNLLSLLNDRSYSEIKEERPHPSITPSKARWTFLERKQQALDPNLKFEPLPPMESLPTPSSSPNL